MSDKGKAKVPPSKATMSSGPVTEGLATVENANGAGVFYNPAQVVNRDLSIVVLRAFIKKRASEPHKKRRQWPVGEERGEDDPKAPDITVLEALSATGLRSIRFALEVPGIKSIVANDLDPVAVDTIKHNIGRNNGAEDIVTANLGDANVVMHTMAAAQTCYDVIDLDPYGTVSPFIDAAIQAVADGGIILATCTDMGVLCGGAPATCFSKYNAMPLQGDGCHERALRIVLAALQTSAGRYKRVIIPLLSVSIDFYVRVVVRVYVSAEQGHTASANIGMVSKCVGCHSQEPYPFGKVKDMGNGKYRAAPCVVSMTPQCDVCGMKKHIGGPIWLGELHSPEFLSLMMDELKTATLPARDRVAALMTTLTNELIDVPFYHSPSSMSNVLHVTTPPLSFLTSSIVHHGYRVSRTHADHKSIKTDMPNALLWDLLVVWAKRNPTKRSTNPAKNTAAEAIMKRPAAIDIAPEGGHIKMVGKFLLTPPYWGPGKRPRRDDDDDDDEGDSAKKTK